MRLYLFGVLGLLCSNFPQGQMQCPSDSLVLYHAVMKTHWNRENFPRHFPGFGYRPSAQWSKLIGLKKFAETSSSDGIDENSSSSGVFDAFNAPSIPSGDGQTQTQFFLDGNHTEVSLIARVVPSPDWFVGVDSVDLCLNGEWIDSISIDLKEYSLSALRSSDNYNPLDPIHRNLLNDIETIDIANELTQLELRDEMTARAAKKHRSRKMRGSRLSKDCTVSEWSEWSECSALCGFGEQRRNRYVTSHPRGGGVLCPPLSEKRLCNSARECRDNYFDW